MSNQEIKLKRKVQLREKTEKPNVVSTPPDNVNTHKSRKWILGGGAVIVIGLIGYWGVSKSDKVAEETSSTEVVEEVIAGQSTTTSELEKENIADENTVDTDATTPSENIIGSQAETRAKPVAESHTSETAKPSTSLANSNVSNDVEAEAMKVIRGDYGVGQERKNRLGAKYQTIQNRVNELKRKGVF